MTGLEPELSTAGGTSGWPFHRPTGAQVVELGPINATIHKLNEVVLAADLPRLAAIYQGVMECLLLGQAADKGGLIPAVSVLQRVQLALVADARQRQVLLARHDQRRPLPRAARLTETTASAFIHIPAGTMSLLIPSRSSPGETPCGISRAQRLHLDASTRNFGL